MMATSGRSRFNGIYRSFLTGVPGYEAYINSRVSFQRYLQAIFDRPGWPDDGYQWEVSFQRYLQIILNRCVWVRSSYQFKGLVSTVSTSDFQEVGVRSRSQNDIYISTNDFAK